MKKCYFVTAVRKYIRCKIQYKGQNSVQKGRFYKIYKTILQNSDYNIHCIIDLNTRSFFQCNDYNRPNYK